MFSRTVFRTLVIAWACAAFSLLTACSTSREIKTPSGKIILMEDAPAEEVWIALDNAANKGETIGTILTVLGQKDLAPLIEQFSKATEEANQAAQRADVPISLFRDLRDTVVTELAETLPAIAREKGFRQYLYIGRFEDQSTKSYPDLKTHLHGVASHLQQHHNFNETVDIMASSFSRLDQVTAEIESGLLASSPTGAPSQGVNRRDVWVLTGIFSVTPRKGNREVGAIINLELTNLGNNRTITRSKERTYYFHPAKGLMKFITEEENQAKWRNWNSIIMSD